MAEKILKAVSDASGVSIDILKSRLRTKRIANVRGVFYALCNTYSISPNEAGKCIHRNHSTVIEMGRRYSGIISLGYPEIVTIYEEAKHLLADKKHS